MGVVAAAETPYLRGGRGDGATRAVLVLHGGREHGRMPTSSRQLAYLRMLDLYWALRRGQNADCVNVSAANEFGIVAGR